jgi:hypothetical protein
MLTHCFQHLDGVDADTEEQWWSAGLHDWSAATLSTLVPGETQAGLEESVQRFGLRDSVYFSQRLRPSERWRLYSDFFFDAAFVDIETTGLAGFLHQSCNDQNRSRIIRIAINRIVYDRGGPRLQSHIPTPTTLLLVLLKFRYRASAQSGKNFE